MKLEVQANVRRPNGFRLEAHLACDTPVLGLIGPSGCGKSTLLDAIAGIEPGARVVLDGRDLSRVPLHRRGVGYVTQDALLFPHLTVRQNITYSPTAGPIEEVTRALGIAHLLDRMPRNVSGGERRRIALARAIASRPGLLLLDEPFGGLDETRRREALAVTGEVSRRFGIPMIVVSHLMEEVVGLAGQVVRLEQGRVSETGPSAMLLREGEVRVDNYFVGQVAGPGRVIVGGVELQAALPADAQGSVRLACYAHNILLATHAPPDISARNVVTSRVAAVMPAGGAVLVEIAHPALRALVTRESAAELGLQEGREVVALIKATAIAYLGSCWL
jgi:molybdate transport system ATP-binding protein